MKTVESIESKEGLQKGVWTLCFLVSLFLFALGQPDRPQVFCYLSYFIGLPLFFFTILRVKSAKGRFILSTLWAFAVELVFLSWLGTTHYHGSGILIAYVLLSLLLAVQFGATIFVLPVKEPPRLGHALLFSAIWSITEWSRLYYFCGFPFGVFGQVLTFDPIPMQLASIFGIYGLSFWVVFIGILGGIAFTTLSKKNGILWLFLSLVPFAFGFIHYEIHQELLKKAPLSRVALVQPGLSSEEKWEFPGSEKRAIAPLDQWQRVFDRLRSFEHKRYDLIVLPEVAFPGDAHDPQFLFYEVVEKLQLKFDRLPLFTPLNAMKDQMGKWYVSHAWIAQTLADLFYAEVVVGLLDYDEEYERSYNSAFHFVPLQNKMMKYNKRVLVPLSEYLPFPFFSSFVAKFGIDTFFTPGEKTAVFFGRIPMTVSICYEEGFNNIIREGRLAGAKLLVNVSNDGWFPNSRLPKEHFHLGKVRAIENGVPLVRACNTGVSAIVDALGKTTASLNDVDFQGKWVSGVVVDEVSTYSFESVYAKLGNGLILLVASLIIVMFLLIKTKPFSRLFP